MLAKLSLRASTFSEVLKFLEVGALSSWMICMELGDDLVLDVCGVFVLVMAVAVFAALSVWGRNRRWATRR